MTGVQTCALPIYHVSFVNNDLKAKITLVDLAIQYRDVRTVPHNEEIGRASCRERV